MSLIDEAMAAVSASFRAYRWPPGGDPLLKAESVGCGAHPVAA
jgi:hypothetical protein